MHFIIAQDRQREILKKKNKKIKYLMIENKRTVYTEAIILIQMSHSCHYHPVSYNLPINAKHFP